MLTPVTLRMVSGCQQASEPFETWKLIKCKNVARYIDLSFQLELSRVRTRHTALALKSFAVLLATQTVFGSAHWIQNGRNLARAVTGPRITQNGKQVMQTGKTNNVNTQRYAAHRHTWPGTRKHTQAHIWTHRRYFAQKPLTAKLGVFCKVLAVWEKWHAHTEENHGKSLYQALYPFWCINWILDMLPIASPGANASHPTKPQHHGTAMSGPRWLAV